MHWAFVRPEWSAGTAGAGGVPASPVRWHTRHCSRPATACGIAGMAAVVDDVVVVVGVVVFVVVVVVGVVVVVLVVVGVVMVGGVVAGLLLQAIAASTNPSTTRTTVRISTAFFNSLPPFL